MIGLMSPQYFFRCSLLWLTFFMSHMRETCILIYLWKGTVSSLFTTSPRPAFSRSGSLRIFFSVECDPGRIQCMNTKGSFYNSLFFFLGSLVSLSHPKKASCSDHSLFLLDFRTTLYFDPLSMYSAQPVSNSPVVHISSDNDLHCHYQLHTAKRERERETEKQIRRRCHIFLCILYCSPRPRPDAGAAVFRDIVLVI